MKVFVVGRVISIVAWAILMMHPPWMPWKWCMGGGFSQNPVTGFAVIAWQMWLYIAGIETTAPTAVQRWMVMGMREKLIKFLVKAEMAADKNGFYNCNPNIEKAKFIADHLIANGVTIQKWIPAADQ